MRKKLKDVLLNNRNPYEAMGFFGGGIIYLFALLATGMLAIFGSPGAWIIPTVITAISAVITVNADPLLRSL